MIHTIRIGLVGDFHPTYQAHQAIPRAVELATADLGCQAELTWLSTAQVEQEGEATLADFDGLWCVPGSPYESISQCYYCVFQKLGCFHFFWINFSSHDFLSFSWVFPLLLALL